MRSRRPAALLLLLLLTIAHRGAQAQNCNAVPDNCYAAPTISLAAGGCTYDPASNTGVVMVRHLVNSSLTDPQQYQLYSLIDTGILP